MKKILTGRLSSADIHEWCVRTQGKGMEKEKGKLYQLTQNEDKQVAFNALRVFSQFEKEDMEWLFAKQNELIDRAMSETHVGCRRLLLRLLLHQPFEEETLRADFIDFCVGHITACAQPYAIRASCMKLAYEQMKFYPELLQELRVALDMLEQEPLSPGLLSAKRQIDRKIKRQLSRF